MLNGGQGVARGSIRITDRSGAHADIDLSAVQTIDDVLDAINNAARISVRPSPDGDHIRLIDTTGQSAANLKVQEVGGGQHGGLAGLAGINVADPTRPTAGTSCDCTPTSTSAR